MSGPLAGVRILDLSRLLPGGACTRLLADLGAEVIKVERAGRGDETRGEPPMLADGVSAVHQYLDAGKRSVALDLKDADDVQVALALATECEVVVESFRPGTASRMGVGPEHVAAVNPAAVYASLTGFGQTGPRASAAGHDLTYEAYAGSLSTIGTPEVNPAMSGVLAADMSGATLAAVGILAGVIEARATGRGRHVDVSLQDAATWSVALPLAQVLADGDASWAPGEGALTGAWPCYGLYACADGLHVAVGALEPHFWARFAELIGRPDLVDRRTDSGAIAEVATVLAQRPRHEWLALLEDQDCCVAPVRTLHEAALDEQFTARDMTVQVAGEGWQVSQPGLPFTVSDHVVARAPARDLGADTAWARDNT